MPASFLSKGHPRFLRRFPLASILYLDMASWLYVACTGLDCTPSHWSDCERLIKSRQTENIAD